MKHVLIFFIRVYQKLFSFDHSFWARPDVFRICLHYPSCSAYAIEALTKYGAIKGVYLATKRVLRCHPFTKDRFDPVP